MTGAGLLAAATELASRWPALRSGVTAPRSLAAAARVTVGAVEAMWGWEAPRGGPVPDSGRWLAVEAGGRCTACAGGAVAIAYCGAAEMLRRRAEAAPEGTTEVWLSPEDFAPREGAMLEVANYIRIGDWDTALGNCGLEVDMAGLEAAFDAAETWLLPPRDGAFSNVLEARDWLDWARDAAGALARYEARAGAGP